MKRQGRTWGVAAMLAATVVATPVVAQSVSPQSAPAPGTKAAAIAPLADRIDALFQRYVADRHVPGLVYGIVADGKLVLVKGIGTQDQAGGRPVTADTRFRIASMSKAFTALAILDLRDQGKLSLDAPAETYVPEMRGWRYPTTDAPRITVRDLLNHVAGFVDDNPWGDRQQVLTEAQFTKMLAAGVPFAHGPEAVMEYSNFGYATLGRIVGNVSGRPYQDYIRDRIMRPLGMTATGYDIAKSPAGSRAIGYRWQDGAFVREPDMADGAFGAMGGVETSANDYARYVAWLLSAWPARDGAETGPLKRSTVRQIGEGSNFATLGERRAGMGEGACATATAYGMGWRVIADCDLSYLTHTGGYPGYGSVVMLMPDAGVGVFAFASLTYGAPSAPAYRTAMLLKEAGLLAPPPVAVTPRLATAYAAVGRMWQAGDVMAAPQALAVNMLMDRAAELRRRDFAAWKAQAGACDTGAPVTATSMMAGTFRWRCEKAVVTGSLLLAPTPAPTVQEIRFTVEGAPAR